MKQFKKKSLFAAILALSIATVSAFTITSCSAVSKDILNNMVNTGDGTKFSKNVTLNNEIEAALTDKSATDAFKGKIVDKILVHWWDSIKDDNPTIKDKDKTFNNDIDKDWDDKVSSLKSSHKGDWEYFMQNQELNPVGGTKAKWKEAQRASKIRSYFTDEIFKTSYLATIDPSSNTENLDNTVSQTPTNCDTQSTNGSDADTNILNYKNWKNIDFYPQAGNSSYSANTDNNKFLDASYAVIQRAAFEEYTKHRHPISTAMVLWKYSDATEADLKQVYREDKNHVASDSLSKASYSFPYFAPNTDLTKNSASYIFYDFMSKFLANATDGGFIEKETGLNRIPYSKTNGYTSDSSDVFLVNADTGLTDSYETYGGPILQMWGDMAYSDATNKMTLLSCPTDGYVQDTNKNIMDVFLRDAALTPAPTDTYDQIDLSSLYASSNNASGKPAIELFDKENPWFTDTNPKKYLYNAFQLKSVDGTDGDNQKDVPYILIRNDAGVHVEGIDGYQFLAKPIETGFPAQDYGYPWSQKRENQILKYRTLCENKKGADSRSGEGIAFLKKDGTGPLNDYFKSNTNDIILQAAFNTLVHNVDVLGQTGTNWKNKNVLGLAKDDPNNDIFNDGNFRDLVLAIAQYNLFNTNLTNYDASNKKLLAFGNTYRQNAFASKTTSVPITHDPKVYKNGLAIALPIKMVSGSSNETSPFKVDTNYIASQYAERMVWTNISGLGNTVDPTDPIFGDPSVATVATLDSLKAEVISKFNTLYASHQFSGAPSKDTHEYNASGKKNGLSENILVNRDEINALLWSFGGSNNFSNIEKSRDLINYYTKNTQSLSEPFDDQIRSIYKTSKLIGNDTTSLATYNNTANLSFDNFKKTLDASFTRTLSATPGGFNGTISPDAANTNIYASPAMDYLTLKATIAYLCKDGHKAFVQWLRDKLPQQPWISQNSMQPLYVAWCVKDNTTFNTGFGSDTSTNADFGWKYNYNGNIDGMYQSTNNNGATPAIGQTSYTTSTNYYQYCKDTTGVAPKFGFYGIQTANSSTLPDEIKTDLFTNWTRANCGPTGTTQANYNLNGALYGLQSPGYIFNTLLPKINNMQDLITFVNSMNTQTNGILQSTIDFLNQHSDVNAGKEQLKTDLTNWINANGLIDLFKGYNAKTAATPCLDVTNNTPGDYKFRDDSQSALCSRARVVAINYQELNNFVDNFNDAYNNLELILTGDVVKSLLVQAAMDTNMQAKAISDVISTEFNGNKLDVYDRRYNDQLGSDWVKDYKNQNS